MHIKNENPAYGAGLEPFAGIPTFMRQPASRNLDGIDVAVVGIPFDSGTTSRNGARMAPRKIRECSLSLWGYNRLLDVGPLDLLNLVDYGDIAIESGNIETTFKRISQQVQPIVDAGAKVISLGGDHTVTFPLLKAHAEKYGPLAVVHFDSHCDTEEGYFNNHGTPFADAYKAGLIDTSAYIKVGIRGPIMESDEVQVAESQGARILTIERCFKEGIDWVIEQIHRVAGNKQVYVSLDIDAVDPAYAPGTGTPEVGGFTSFQILQLVRGLKGLDTVGFDLVEVSPPYDSPGEITSILAANLVFEFLSLLALKKR